MYCNLGTPVNLCSFLSSWRLHFSGQSQAVDALQHHLRLQGAATGAFPLHSPVRAPPPPHPRLPGRFARIGTEATLRLQQSVGGELFFADAVLLLDVYFNSLEQPGIFQPVQTEFFPTCVNSRFFQLACTTWFFNPWLWSPAWVQI